MYPERSRAEAHHSRRRQTMALVAMAFPIPPGKTEQWKTFVGELTGARRAEFNESRRKLDVHERTFLQHTPMGDLVLVTLEGANPEAAFAGFAADNSPFAQWFKAEVQKIHGIDFNQPPPPMPKLVVDSNA